MVVLIFIWKSIHAIQFILGLYTYWVTVQNWLAFGPRPNFGPLVATKWLKIVVSNNCLKKYSCNPIQTWCVHLLGECSESICFWATLAKFGPSSGHKMTENCGFRPLSGKVPLCGIMITQSISNMVFTLVRGVFANRPHRPNLAPLVTISVFSFPLLRPQAGTVFPFPLLRPQAGTCILWCLVLFLIPFFFKLIVACRLCSIYVREDHDSSV